MRRRGRALIVGILLTSLAIVVHWGTMVNPALATHCSQVVDWDMQATDVDHTFAFGVRGDIYVNDFDNQHLSIRSLFFIRSVQHWAEVGWHQGHRDEPGGERVVNKVWLEAGVVDHEHFNFSSLDPDTTHEWKIHDANTDRWWSFAYDGSSLGNEFISMDYASPETLTEVKCSSDSAWAHFSNLRNCITACLWQDFATLEETLDQNPNYCFDVVSDTEHYVRLVC